MQDPLRFVGKVAKKGFILAEGAIALSVTLSGGALFASRKLLQFPSSLIVKVILAIFRGASAQRAAKTKLISPLRRIRQRIRELQKCA